MESGGQPVRLYWGDLHNHCSVGLFHYAKGSLERAIDIAQTHLDFFAFTGHSQWHDIPKMPQDAHLKWQEGFDRHTEHWPKTKALIRSANRPGEFVAFLGYEWHSAKYGDRCIVFRDDEGELKITPDLSELEAYAERVGALLCPHHIGYKELLPGRGINWAHLNPERCPVIEIVSEHGCAERDRGLWPYISHTLGPRTTKNTYRNALAMGLHCGVVGGSDDHFGFPGAYGEGLVGVYTNQLTREGILDAVWKRRTLAATGDRIAIQFYLNDGVIGDVLPPAEKRHIRVFVKAWDEIDKIELIKNNRVIHRRFVDDALTGSGWPDRALLRVEYGWGPWSALGMARTADWDVSLDLADAQIVGWQPCLQCGPFDEDRRHRLDPIGPNAFHWRSYTGREGAYREAPTNAIVFELAGEPDAEVRLSFKSPAARMFEYTLADLLDSSRIEFMGTFPSESILVHRLVPESAYAASFELEDAPSGRSEDFYYVRVTECNGHMAWCSPIWVQG